MWGYLRYHAPPFLLIAKFYLFKTYSVVIVTSHTSYNWCGLQISCNFEKCMNGYTIFTSIFFCVLILMCTLPWFWKKRKCLRIFISNELRRERIYIFLVGRIYCYLKYYQMLIIPFHDSEWMEIFSFRK